MTEPVTFGSILIAAFIFGFIVILGIAAIHSMEQRIQSIENRINAIQKNDDNKYVLSSKDVQDIKKLISNGISKTQIANTYGVSRQTLYNALKR